MRASRGVVPCHAISVGRFEGPGELRWTAHRLRLALLLDDAADSDAAAQDEQAPAARWTVLSLRGKVTRAELRLGAYK